VILVLGDIGEDVFGFVVSRLAEARAEFMLVDARAPREAVDLAWRPEPNHVGGWIRSGDRTAATAELRSIYVRDVGRPEHTPSAGTTIARSGMLEGLPCLVVNRPSAMASNASKPYQAQLISRSGLRVPQTLVTTIPAEAARFYDRYDGRVVFKSVSYLRSIVRRMTPDDLGRLERVRGTPTQFQEYVPGIDIRVHVVGDELFATEVLSTATDYRYAVREDRTVLMRDMELPPRVEHSCRSLASLLGLEFAGIDLRRTPDDRWFCFEANGSPGFTYFQALSGQPIGDALVALLMAGGRA